MSILKLALACSQNMVNFRLLPVTTEEAGRFLWDSPVPSRLKASQHRAHSPDTEGQNLEEVFLAVSKDAVMQ